MNIPKIQKKYQFGIAIIIATFINSYLVSGDFGDLIRFIAIGIFLPSLIIIMIGNRGRKKMQESSKARKINIWAVIIFLIIFGLVIWSTIGVNNGALGIILTLGITGFCLLIMLIIDFIWKKSKNNHETTSHK